MWKFITHKCETILYFLASLESDATVCSAPKRQFILFEKPKKKLMCIVTCEKVGRQCQLNGYSSSDHQKCDLCDEMKWFDL